MDSSMFDSNKFIHMVWIILSDYDEYPHIHSSITPSCYYLRLRWIFLSITWHITHRSTLVCVCGYVSYFNVDPHCILWWLWSILVMEWWIHTISLGGHDLSLCLMHGSIVYFWQLWLLTKHRYAYLRDIHLWWSNCCFLLITSTHLGHPQLWSVSVISHTLWPHTLGGIYYTVNRHPKSENTICWLNPTKILLFPKELNSLTLSREKYSSKSRPQFLVAGYTHATRDRVAIYPLTSHDQAVA